jgi:hypothetical protein
MVKKNRIKFVCLIFFITVTIFLLTDNKTVTSVHAFSSGPTAGLTGAPGEGSCTECHGGAPNVGPGQFTITGLPARYDLGMTYQVTVTHTTTDNSRRRWGFQLTALTANNTKAGELTNNSGFTSILNNDGPGGNRQYIEHNIQGTFAGQNLTASWTFNWTAPATNIGAITFYASGNQANNNSGSTGDQIYITSEIVNPPATNTGLPLITEARVNKKQLIITGENFDFGAVLLMDGAKVKKTFNDEINPTTVMVARKAGNQIVPGQEVMLQIRNLDGTLSNIFPFRRPE